MKEIRITSENQLDLEHIRIHDCCFTGFQYNYDQRTLFFSAWHVYERRKIGLTFHGVVDVSMQSCDFFGGGNSILCLYSGGKERLDQLVNHAKQNPQSQHERLARSEDILCVKMELNSGDELTILCEYLFVSERELQINQMIMPDGQKSLWLPCAYALQHESNAALLPHLQALFEWLKDMNWPGANLIAKRIRQIPETQLLPACEKAILRAQHEQDEEWHENLHMLVKGMNKSSTDELR